MGTSSPVKVECGSCRGTGLYRGFAEPLGVAVVCLYCGGSGCRDLRADEVTIVPFTEHKRRSDVRIVQRSRGAFILSCGPVGASVSYEEFLRGRLP